jgi:excisionase family DNA binding protein
MLELPNKTRFLPSEVPQYLPLSRRRVYQLIEEGKIHPIDRCGKKMIIPRDSLVSFLRASDHQ